jgi:hypothetical protein
VLEGQKWGLGGDEETLGNREIFISQSLVNSTSKCERITTTDYLLSLHIYAAYRRQHPEEETVKNAMMEFEENNIGVSQVVECPHHCQ